MKEYFFVVFYVLLFFSGCKENEITPPLLTDQDGQIILKIDRLNAPQNITTVTAYLTRPGFTTITGSLNLLTDTTADLSLQDIAAGIWHLKVDAADSLGVVKYMGETNVNVLENQTIQVTLQLIPVPGNGVGNIYLYVTWGGLGNWIDYPGNPVFTGINNGYEIYGVNDGKILFEDNKYKMWYTGVNPNAEGVIEYAESVDGVHWIRPINHPLIYPGNSGSWDQHGVHMGAIIKDGSNYKLYYGGMDARYGNWSIGLAVSNDGINWEKHPNPVLLASGTGWEQKIGPSDITKVNGTYYLYYNGMVYNYPGTYIEYKIAVATSTDGIMFTKNNANPILYPTVPWEGPDILGASVYYENGTFTMVYMNNSRGTTNFNWAFGKATSADGITWTKAMDNPFFKGQQTANHWTSWIGFPYYRKLNDQYRIYYSAEFHNPMYYKMGYIQKL